MGCGVCSHNCVAMLHCIKKCLSREVCNISKNYNVKGEMILM